METKKLEAMRFLQTVPASTKVAELYDLDLEFNSSVNSACGPDLEYPNFSHKKVGEIVDLLDMEMAEGIAKAKPVVLLHASPNSTYVGSVLGVTDSQCVQNLGRIAIIHSMKDLDKNSSKGEFLSIKYNGQGHAKVANQALNAGMEIG